MSNLKFNEAMPWLIIATLGLYILFTTKSDKTVEVAPVAGSDTIESPAPEIRIDTLYKDSAYEKIVQIPNEANEELLLAYKKAVSDNDSLKALALYKEAVIEHSYTTLLNDTNQVITVKSEVVGTLQRQIISYVTKPKTIELKNEGVKMRPSLFVGAFGYAGPSSAVGVNVGMLNSSKKKLIFVGYDTRKNINVGIMIKLF